MYEKPLGNKNIQFMSLIPDNNSSVAFIVLMTEHLQERLCLDNDIMSYDTLPSEYNKPICYSAQLGVLIRDIHRDKFLR